jgi:uncharacterized small protein (DUF1192 family)
MDFDDLPRPAPIITVGQKLTELSIGDLEERIAALQSEIARTESELASKRAGRAAADAVFSKR